MRRHQPRTRARVSAAALLAARFLFAAPVAHAGDPPDPALASLPAAAADTWLEVKLPRVTVYTNAGDGLASGMGRRVEQLMDTFAALNPKLRAVPTQPLEMVVLRGAGLTTAFMPLGVENPAGVSMRVQGRNVCVVNGDVEGTDKAQVVCHEITHLLLGANYADLPVFLNEGLAEYYGTFRARGAKAEVGARNDWEVEWVTENEHQLVPLDLLFTMNTLSNAYTRDNSIRFATYAEGWMLVHWLFADPARAAKFETVLEDMRHGTGAHAAFAKQFPESDWPAMLALVGRYPRDQFIEPKAVPLARAAASIPAAVRPLPAAEALRRLGDLLCDLGDERRPTALRYYTAALERDSSDAAACAGAGYAADACGDSATASRMYARAAALAPDDPKTALRVALGLEQRWQRCYRHTSERSAEALLPLAHDARDAFARVMRLDEQDTEALVGFGTMCLAGGQVPEAAVSALATAAEALPGREDVQQAYATARRMKSEGATPGAAH